MNRFSLYATAVIRTLFGLALIGYCGDAFHDEFARGAERSLILLGGLAAAVVFGALIVPGLNHAVEDGGRSGFRLFSLGRRAYDGKAIVTEEAPAAPKGDA